MIARLVAFALLLAPSAQAFEVCDAAKDPKAFDASDRWALIAEQGLDGWIFAKGELLSLARLGSARDPLGRFAAALRGQGILPILIAIPNRLTLASDKLDPSKPEFASYQPTGVIRMHHEHARQLQEAGWEVPDLVALGESSGLGAEFFNDKDHHWSTQGARVTADAIAALVKAWPGATGIPSVAFDLAVTEVRNPGSYRWIVLDRCGVDIPAELTKSYKAVSTSAVSTDALLGDAVPPQVVLLGTSQSRRQDYDVMANRQYFEDSFSALLRHALQMDVANLAAAGGGTFTSMDGWLTSREFQKNKPKVIVWEMNDSEGFEPPATLRSLVPAVHGRCSKADAVVQASGTVADGMRFDLPPGLSVRGTDYYLALKLTDPSMVAFDLTFHHGSRRDSLSVQRSPLLPNSKLFFAELSGSITAPLTAVSVKPAPDASGRWEARICAAP